MYCGNVWDAVCTQAGNVKVRQYWESQRGALCLQSGQHAVGFLPDADRAGQTLSEMSRPKKRLFVLSDSSQCRTRSEQACLVVGVCERTQRVCVCDEESETVCNCACWCTERYCGFSFLSFFCFCLSVYLYVLAGLGCKCVYVCAIFFLFIWCVFVVLLLQRTDLGSS